MAGIMGKIGETLHIGGHKEGEKKQDDVHYNAEQGYKKPEQGEHKEGLVDKLRGHGTSEKKDEGHEKKKKDKKKKKHGEEGHDKHHDDHGSSSSDSD